MTTTHSQAQDQVARRILWGLQLLAKEQQNIQQRLQKASVEACLQICSGAILEWVHRRGLADCPSATLYYPTGYAAAKDESHGVFPGRIDNLPEQGYS